MSCVSFKNIENIEHILYVWVNPDAEIFGIPLIIRGKEVFFLSLIFMAVMIFKFYDILFVL